MKPCLTGLLLQYFKTQELENGRLPVDVELTVVEKRRISGQRSEARTTDAEGQLHVWGSLDGILVKKVTIMSLLSLFSLDWFLQASNKHAGLHGREATKVRAA